MAEEIRRHPNGRDYKRGADGKWHLVQTSPESISLTGPDPLQGPKVREATNEARASDLAPAQAGANLRKTEAEIRNDAERLAHDRQQFQANLALKGLMVDPSGNIVPRPDGPIVGKDDPKSGAYRGLQEQIDRVRELYRQRLQGGLPNVVNNVVPDFAQPEVGAFDSAAAGLYNPFMAAFRIEGVGSQSDTELQQFIKSNTPGQGDSDAVVEEKLGNIQRRLDAQLNTPPAPESTAPTTDEVQPQLAPSDGKTRTEIDPIMRATAGRLGKMIADGAPPEEVYKFASESGLNLEDPKLKGSLDQAIQYRGSEDYRRWQRANPGKSYPISPDFYTREVPLTGSQRTMNTAAQSGLGAYAAASANAMTGGRLDSIAGALGGDPEAVRTGMMMTRDMHPGASFAGDMTGQMLLEGTLNRIPGVRGFTHTPWGRRAEDLAYGAFSGSGEGDSLFDVGGAVGGGAAGMAFGGAGRRAFSGGRRIATGIRDTNPESAYLHDQGVDLTVGRIGRGSRSRAGEFVGGLEERAAGFPIAENIINPARRRGDEGFNRAAFRQIGEPAGMPGTGQVGSAGIAEADATRTAAFNFLDGTNIPIDAPYAGAQAGVRTRIPALPDFGPQTERTMDLLDRSFDATGNLTGRNWQSGVRSLRQARTGVQGQPFGNEAADLLRDAEGNLINLAERQLPGHADNLANANAVNMNFETVSAALDNGPAQRADEMFSPVRLDAAARATRRNYGGRTASMSGDRPFYDLTSAGMRVMPSLTPDSGTAGRAALGVLAGTVGGAGAGGAVGGASNGVAGAGEGAQDGALWGGLGAAGLAALYSRPGQRALQNMLLGERAEPINRLEDFFVRHPELRRRFRNAGGMLGSALARDLLFQPELP